MSRSETRRLLTPGEASAYLGGVVSESTLSKWRFYKKRHGPPYMKLGLKIVYDADALDRWLASCEHGAEPVVVQVDA
jgi:hypothetical protein